MHTHQKGLFCIFFFSLLIVQKWFAYFVNKKASPNSRCNADDHSGFTKVNEHREPDVPAVEPAEIDFWLPRKNLFSFGFMNIDHICFRSEGGILDFQVMNCWAILIKLFSNKGNNNGLRFYGNRVTCIPGGSSGCRFIELTCQV